MVLWSELWVLSQVEDVEATSEPKEQAVVREQGVAEEVVKEQEDMVEKVKEKAAVPKCIGPGCSNEALPESVYCGHQCIIRHAAVAMHGLSEPKAQPEIKNKPAPKPTLKVNQHWHCSTCYIGIFLLKNMLHASYVYTQVMLDSDRSKGVD